MRLLLFDIDNTLLWSGGAGSHAMSLAFHELYGVENGFKAVEFSGRTDRYILAEALRQHGIDGDYGQHQELFLERYYAHLAVSLREREGRLMPGFPMVLDALSHRPEVRLGLATGNFSRAAQMKLEHYRIGGYFRGGGFGEVSEDRSLVVRQAIETMTDGVQGADAVIIGDTPHDITAAKANGAMAVGVATGSNSAEELRASGADAVFADFTDWEEASARLSGAA